MSYNCEPGSTITVDELVEYVNNVEGKEGPQGVPGEGISLEGAYPYNTILYISGQAGDCYVTTDDGDVWNVGDGMVCDGLGVGVSHWSNIGPLVGPQGPPGAGVTDCYRLDGSQALEADFRSNGYSFKDAGPATEVNDLTTLGQVEAKFIISKYRH